VVPRGETLYHGTWFRGTDAELDEFVYPDAPAWFSETRGVAEKFSASHKWGRGRVVMLEYRVTRRIPGVLVFDYEGWVRFNRLAKRDSGWDADDDDMDIVDLAESLCDNGLRGWRVLDNYQPGDDLMLCGGYESYLERTATWLMAGPRWERYGPPCGGVR